MDEIGTLVARALLTPSNDPGGLSAVRRRVADLATAFTSTTYTFGSTQDAFTYAQVGHA
jgi:hypothetical protein